MQLKADLYCLGARWLQVIRELSRNKWMDPKQAIEYGMIDKVRGGWYGRGQRDVRE